MDNPVIDETVISKEAESNEIIKKYVLWSAGAGLIPIPIADIAAVMAVQLKMIKDLADLYNISFAENKTKAIIATLVGSIAPSSMATGTFSSMLKAIPLVGTLLGSVSMSISSAAFTYAVGKVFVQHFELGGTLLDFDAAKMKHYFAEHYKEGQRVAADMRTR